MSTDTLSVMYALKALSDEQRRLVLAHLAGLDPATVMRSIEHVVTR